jgi:hypothetical protein
MGKVIYIKDWLKRSNKYYVTPGCLIRWNDYSTKTIQESVVEQIMYLPANMNGEEVEVYSADLNTESNRYILRTRDHKTVWGDTVIGKRAQ